MAEAASLHDHSDLSSWGLLDLALPRGLRMSPRGRHRTGSANPIIHFGRFVKPSRHTDSLPSECNPVDPRTDPSGLEERMATAEVDRSRRMRALSPLRGGPQSPRLTSPDDHTGERDSSGTKASLESYCYRMSMKVWGRSAASPMVSDEPSLSTAMAAVAEDSQLSQGPEVPSK